MSDLEKENHKKGIYNLTIEYDAIQGTIKTGGAVPNAGVGMVACLIAAKHFEFLMEQDLIAQQVDRIQRQQLAQSLIHR